MADVIALHPRSDKVMTVGEHVRAATAIVYPDQASVPTTVDAFTNREQWLDQYHATTVSGDRLELTDEGSRPLRC